MTELQGDALLQSIQLVNDQLTTMIQYTIGVPPIGQETILYITASITFIIFITSIVTSLLIFQWKWGGKK